MSAEQRVASHLVQHLVGDAVRRVYLQRLEAEHPHVVPHAVDRLGAACLCHIGAFQVAHLIRHTALLGDRAQACVMAAAPDLYRIGRIKSLTVASGRALISGCLLRHHPPACVLGCGILQSLRSFCHLKRKARTAVTAARKMTCRHRPVRAQPSEMCKAQPAGHTSSPTPQMAETILLCTATELSTA